MARRRAPGGGRKPLPTAIKALRGNPGKRDLKAQQAMELRVEQGLPDPPPFLDRTERARWQEIGAELDEIGVVAKTDRGTIALLVAARVRWERCRRKVQRLGEVLTDKESGRLYRNPWAIAAEKAWQQYRAMCMECGVTPASRSKVAPLAGHGQGGQGAGPSGATSGDTGDPYFDAS